MKYPSFAFALAFSLYAAGASADNGPYSIAIGKSAVALGKCSIVLGDNRAVVGNNLIFKDGTQSPVTAIDGALRTRIQQEIQRIRDAQNDQALLPDAWLDTYVSQYNANCGP